jgi:hypothetical protein
MEGNFLNIFLKLLLGFKKHFRSMERNTTYNALLRR